MCAQTVKSADSTRNRTWSGRTGLARAWAWARAWADQQDKKNLAGFVGFANLPNQVHRRSVKKGFQLTILVVGEAGLGKATLINTLFATKVIPARKEAAPGAELANTTVTIAPHTAGTALDKGTRVRIGT